jgi:hypothetical protein
MNVEIGAEAVLFPEQEYINGIFVAVYNTFVEFCKHSRCKSTVMYQHFFYRTERILVETLLCQLSVYAINFGHFFMSLTVLVGLPEFCFCLLFFSSDS